MFDEIARDDVRRLAERGATIIEVLPRREYLWAHLPGALHVPYKDWDPHEAVRALPRDRPVVVYCNNTQ